MLHVGDPAPAFTAGTDAGTRVSLRELRGKTVVLYFYPRDGTRGCTREACAFRDHHRAVLARGAVVLGVSTDTADSHARFREKHGLPFPLLADPERRVVRAYGVWKRKTLYGKTSMGTVRTTFIIDARGVISHIFPRVTVDGHLEQVLAALGERPQA